MPKQKGLPGDYFRLMATARHLFHLEQRLLHAVDGEASGQLHWRILLEGGHKLPKLFLQRIDQEDVIQGPVPIGVGGDGRALERIKPQVDHEREAQVAEIALPDVQGAGRILHHEVQLVVAVAHGQQIEVVGEVPQYLPPALVFLAGQVGKLVVAVQVVLEGPSRGAVAFLEFVGDVGIAGRRDQGGEPVQAGKNFVGDLSRLDMPGPAHQGRDPEAAFPAGVLLVAERRHGRVGPGVHLRAVVRGVDDDGVVGDAQLVDGVEDRAHVLVVVDHDVVIDSLILACLADARRLGVGAEVHVGVIRPQEKRLLGLDLAFDEVLGTGLDVVVDGLHPLLGQGAGVFDPAVGKGVDHAPGAVLFLELRIFRIIGQLRFFLGV